VRGRTLPREQLGMPAGAIDMHPAIIEVMFYTGKLDATEE
jgi:hypothetical protein